MQLSLDLSNKENFDPYPEEEFLQLDENKAALNFLRKFFEQRIFSQAQFPSLMLRGESKSGKTHLLNIFVKQHSAEILQIQNLSNQNLSTLFTPNKFYILENINEIEDEELLLHTINAAVEAKAFLVISSQNKGHFVLRDLTSRLKNIFALDVKNPSPEAIKMLLINAFSRKQLMVPSKIINAISDNIDRTYSAVFDAVRLVEFYREEFGKNITVKDVKRILGAIA